MFPEPLIEPIEPSSSPTSSFAIKELNPASLPVIWLPRRCMDSLKFPVSRISFDRVTSKSEISSSRVPPNDRNFEMTDRFSLFSLATKQSWFPLLWYCSEFTGKVPRNCPAITISFRLISRRHANSSFVPPQVLSPRSSPSDDSLAMNRSYPPLLKKRLSWTTKSFLKWPKT